MGTSDLTISSLCVSFQGTKMAESKSTGKREGTEGGRKNSQERWKIHLELHCPTVSFVCQPLSATTLEIYMLEAYVNNKERPYVYLIKSESCYYLSFSECLIGHCNWQLTVITCWVVNTAGISTLSCAASNHNQVTERIWKIHKIILLHTHANFNILTCKLECSSQGLSH